MRILRTLVYGMLLMMQYEMVASRSRPTFLEQIGYVESYQKGGNDAMLGQFPWAARLFCSYEKVWFGGTLVHEQWIITVATKLLKIKHVAIWLGDVGAIQPRGVYMTSSDFFTHPNFFYSPPTNNIAMIKLPKPVSLSDYIKPIALPTIEVSTEYGSATIVGYGMLNNGTFGNFLRFTKIKLLPVDQCAGICTKADNINASSVICGLTQSETGLCGALQGSTLVRRDVFLGFVSCYSNCNRSEPTLHTKIDPYVGWIQNTINPPAPLNDSKPVYRAVDIDEAADNQMSPCDSFCKECFNFVCRIICEMVCV